MSNSPTAFGIHRSFQRLDCEPYISLHFLMIFVREQERRLRFYVDKLNSRLVVDHIFPDGK
jgi:hypothetical protein